MQLKKSYFNKTIFWKNIKSYWPVWTIFTLVAMIALPVASLISVRLSPNSSIPQDLWYARQFYNITVGDAVSVVSLIFAVFCAMSVFSYLSNHRSASFFHSLPVCREGLFISAYLSGFCFMAVPTIIAVVLNVVVVYTKGGNIIVPALIGLGISLLTELFFYTFAVLCMIVGGNAIAGFVFYGIMNGVFVFMTFVVDELAQIFYFGLTGGLLTHDATSYLCPVYGLSRVYAEYIYSDAEEASLAPAKVIGIELTDKRFLLYYGIIAVIFLVIAFVEYKKKHTESVGEVITVKWAKPIFKWGFTTCFMLLFTMLVYSIFFSGDRNSEWYVVISAIIFSFVGYIFAEMINKKSFKVFKTMKPVCLIYVFLSALVVLVMKFDITGFEKRVPKSAADVEYVTVALNGDMKITDPAIIGQVIDAHSEIVRNKKSVVDRVSEINQRASEFDYNSWQLKEVVDYTGRLYDDYQDRFDEYVGGRTVYIRLDYHLKNGKELSRRYDIPINFTGGNPEYVQALEDIYNNPSCVYARIFDDADPVNFDLKYSEIVLHNDNYLEKDVMYTNGEANGLLQAVMRDIDAGNFRTGLYDLYKDSGTAIFETLIFNFVVNEMAYQQWNMNNEHGYTVPANAVREGYSDDLREITVYVRFTKDCVNTINFLKAHGAFEDGYSIYSEAEYNRLQENRYKW